MCWLHYDKKHINYVNLSDKNIKRNLFLIKPSCMKLPALNQHTTSTSTNVLLQSS